MKKLLLVGILALVCFSEVKAQEVCGQIISTEDNITILRVWGNHHQRGLAIGYLLSVKIDSVINYFVKPMYGADYDYIRSLVADTAVFSVNEEMRREIIGATEGLALAGVYNIDEIDILVLNALYDINSFYLKKNGIMNPGCSSLISWGEATGGLDGKTIHTRHFDFYIDDVLINSQVMVINLPEERDEQPWLFTGFAGQIAGFSFINVSGVNAFIHSMDIGSGGSPSYDKHYNPICFAVREGIEKKDFNNDSRNNVIDIENALLAGENGYAAASIIPVSCSYNGEDTLTALIAEVTPTDPKFSFRDNRYNDTIPGDNLYAANSAIARNNQRLYCNRYISIRNNLGQGTLVDPARQWTLMYLYSSLWNNMQFMQVIPELKVFKLSVYRNNYPAYFWYPVIYNIDTLFNPVPQDVKEEIHSVSSFALYQNYPNPFNPVTRIRYSIPKGSEVTLKIYNLVGQETAVLVDEYKEAGDYSIEFNGEGLSSGLYLYKLTAGEFTSIRKMTLMK